MQPLATMLARGAKRLQAAERDIIWPERDIARRRMRQAIVLKARDMEYSCEQVGRAWGRERSVIQHALTQAFELRVGDRHFRQLVSDIGAGLEREVA